MLVICPFCQEETDNRRPFCGSCGEQLEMTPDDEEEIDIFDDDSEEEDILSTGGE